MSNTTRNDRSHMASGRQEAQTPASRSSTMLQESTNPEMFMKSSQGRPSMSLTRLKDHKRLLSALGGLIVLVVVVVVAVVALTGSGGGAPQAPATAPSASGTEQAQGAQLGLDRSKEVPGVMIQYRPDLPDGMTTPSQTIQSMARNFYSLRSTAGVMPYFAPGSPFSEKFIRDNIENLQVGTRMTDMYMFPADEDKLKNKKPLGTDPQVWLVTAMFELPSGKTYVDSMLFMTVKVGGDYKIQEFGTFTN